MDLSLLLLPRHIAQFSQTSSRRPLSVVYPLTGHCEEAFAKAERGVTASCWNFIHARESKKSMKRIVRVGKNLIPHFYKFQ